MCGIAGLVLADGSQPLPKQLDRLVSAISHRGPDGEGRLTIGGTTLAHRRLAIIDLQTGDQPFQDSYGTSLIANGEIYNYRELTEKITDGVLSSKSDCELPLHLYRYHGLAFTEHLRGMYALAIHDSKRGRLVLARDPFGIKPLYYVKNKGCFAFASEPQALVAAGLASRTPCTSAFGELLNKQFIGGRSTAFAEIKRVLPGETLVIEKGQIIEKRYLAALPSDGPREKDFAGLEARLDALLSDSVNVHQRSDVPYGMFLSGGVDSSALLAMMARLNSKPVLTYTAGFDSKSVADERIQARSVAKAVGATHVEITITQQDFWRDLPAIAAALDDPCADYAIVPSFELARVAAKDVKVILSGEGGDELFAGYGRYRRALRPRWLGGREPRMHGLFDRMNVLREASSPHTPSLPDSQLASSSMYSRLQVAQAMDFVDWLPHDLLTKLDRCLMAHGLEGRTPFLDRPLAEFAFCLPDRAKIRGTHGKWLLRSWLGKQLPAAKPFSRKRGFTVPVGEWIRARGQQLGDLVAAQPGVKALCRSGSVAPLFQSRNKHAGQAAWVLLFFSLWYRRHILNLTPEGDVFDCLSSSAEC